MVNGKLSKNTLALLCLLVLGSLTTLDVQALALGRLHVFSSIGEPLRAEVDLIDLTAAEARSLRPSLAPADAYKAMGLNLSTELLDMQFSLVRTPDGRAVLQLKNNRPITAAFVDIVLQVSSTTGKISRDYTLLLTPPKTVNLAVPMAPSQPIKLPPVEPSINAPATTSSAAQSSPAAAREVKAAVKPAQSINVAFAKPVTVARGDTASELGMQNLPINVSLDQMLIALLHSNPDAFVAGNVNRLKVGAVLTMPAAADATTVPRDKARQTIMAQSRDFNAFRQQLANNASPAQVITPGREATGKVQSSVKERTSASAAADKLTLSKGELKSVVPGAVNTDEKLSQERLTKDTADRLAELSKNINDLRKLSATSAAPVASSVPLTSESGPANSSGPALAVSTYPAAAAQASTEQSGLIDRLSKDPIVLPATAGFLGLLLAWGFFRSRRHSADKNGGFRSALQAADSAAYAPPEASEPANIPPRAKS